MLFVLIFLITFSSECRYTFNHFVTFLIFYAFWKLSKEFDKIQKDIEKTFEFVRVKNKSFFEIYWKYSEANNLA